MIPDQPLTDEELDRLDQFLMSDATPDECMDLSMLDGFLTALVIGPNTTLPSRWLPAVWGETADDPMAFGSPEQTELALAWIMRYMNERVHDLREGLDEYEPLIYTREHEGETIPIIDEWCIGFVRGIGLDPEGWRPLLESGADAALLFPIMLYGSETGWEELQANPKLEARHERIAETLGPCVIGIRDYWLPHRKAASTFRRETARLGRNDPCRCGNGKKYKKCCGGGEYPSHRKGTHRPTPLGRAARPRTSAPPPHYRSDRHAAASGGSTARGLPVNPSIWPCPAAPTAPRPEDRPGRPGSGG